jgi:hypothetical protein
MKALIGVLLMVAALLAAAPSAGAAVCSDYASQAEAQAAADTRDGDGDGIYCEELPCPCAGPTSASDNKPAQPTRSECVRTRRVVRVAISRTRYPAVLAHIRQAVREGWPRVLRINRPGADARRERALAGIPTRPGMDRDEWPMAFARKTWRAHVAYVPSDQNRGAGASIGLKLRRYCNGVRFKVIGY